VVKLPGGVSTPPAPLPPEEVDTANLEAFYRLEGSYIDATLEEIEKRYGSMEAFLRDGLGIDDDTLSRLKESLLSPTYE
jgi:protein-tyrosine phosphatase